MSIAIAELLLNIIQLYTLIILAWVISSWLLNFGIINTRNNVVYQIVRTLNALVQPVIAPIQKVIPSFGGLDFSPIVLLFGLQFLARLISEAANGRLL